jgi:hypothetical protein
VSAGPGSTTGRQRSKVGPWGTCRTNEERAVTALDVSRPDVIDVKVTLTGADLPRARSAFGLTGESSRRAVTYFCERVGGYGRVTLLDAGIVLRLRQTDDDYRDAVVVLRPYGAGSLPRALSGRRTGDTVVRVTGDWTPHAHIVAVSATSSVSASALAAALSGNERLSEAFSSEQSALLEEVAPSQLTWRVLRPFGPVEVRSWTREVEKLELLADLWRVRSISLDLLELRVVVEPEDAGLVLPALVALAREHGLDPHSFTGTKTRAVLDRLTIVPVRG